MQSETKSELVERVRKAAEAGSLLSLAPEDVLKVIGYLESAESAARWSEQSASDAMQRIWSLESNQDNDDE